MLVPWSVISLCKSLYHIPSYPHRSIQYDWLLVCEVTHVFCSFYFCVTENTWEQLINHVAITFDGPWPTCSPWILWLLPTWAVASKLFLDDDQIEGLYCTYLLILIWGSSSSTSSSSSSSSSSFIFHEPGLHPYATIICISYVEICSHAFMSCPLLQTHVVRNLRGCCLGGSVRCHFLAQGSGVQSVSWTLRELFSVAHVNLAISPYIHLYPMISPWFSQYFAWSFHVFPSEMPILWDQRNF